MTARWLAGGAVVLGCGYLGMALASGLDVRVRQLEALEAMLAQLTFHIGFLALPLAEALGRTAAGQQGVVRRILEETAASLRSQPLRRPGEAWEAAMRRQRRSLCLKEPEREALREFAAHLGQGDREDTLNNLRMTAAKLKLAREAALAQLARDGKLCRGLGFLAGILLVLLLF